MCLQVLGLEGSKGYVFHRVLQCFLPGCIVLALDIRVLQRFLHMTMKNTRTFAGSNHFLALAPCNPRLPLNCLTFVQNIMFVASVAQFGLWGTLGEANFA